MSIISFQIEIDRINKSFKEGENVTGHILIESKNELKDAHLNAWIEGSVNLQTTTRNSGFLETFSNSSKSTTLIHQAIEFDKTKKILPGSNSVPFNFKLEPRENKKLYDTYHGVYIVIQYFVKCEIKRSIMNKDLQRSVEIIIENSTEKYFHKNDLKEQPIVFHLSSNKDDYLKDTSNSSDFQLIASFNHTVYNISNPLQGTFIVKKSNRPIKSVSIQLVRIETCGLLNKDNSDCTEIQNLQMVDGNVIHGIQIPIHMVFPRLLTCSTLATNNFKIDFEVNLIVKFEDNYIVKESFPIILYRK